MDNKYTEKAQEVLRHAKKTAKNLHLNYTGTEHILMGLVMTYGSVASRILIDNGVDEDRLMHMIRDLIVQDGSVSTLDQDGFRRGRRGCSRRLTVRRRVFMPRLPGPSTSCSPL